MLDAGTEGTCAGPAWTVCLGQSQPTLPGLTPLPCCLKLAFMEPTGWSFLKWVQQSKAISTVFSFSKH